MIVAELTESVQVSLIGSGGLVLVAIVGLLGGLQLKRQKKLSTAVEVVRDQVQNDHGTNLRNDLDRVSQSVSFLDHTVEEVRTDIQWIREHLMLQSRRDIEDTADVREHRTRIYKRLDDLDERTKPKE